MPRLSADAGSYPVAGGGDELGGVPQRQAFLVGGGAALLPQRWFMTTR